MPTVTTSIVTLRIFPDAKGTGYAVEVWRSGQLEWDCYKEPTQAEAIDRAVALLREATGRKD